MSNEISLSLEETNKLRASLGLPLITVDPERAEIPKKEPVKEPAVPKPKEKQNSKVIPDKITDDDKLDDTDDWLSNLSLKKTRKVVVPSPREPQGEYTSKDLKGVKIAHSLQDVADLQDGAVLTLKDANILDEDEEDDQLEADVLVSKKRLKENLRAKLGRDQAKYKGYEEFPGDDNDDEGNDESVLLNGENLNIIGQPKKKEEDQPVGKKRIVLSDDEGLNDENSTDYQKVKPIKVKKLKKSNNHKRTKLDSTVTEKELKYVELSKDGIVGDDDELASVLAAARKKKLEKRAKITPEQFIAQHRPSSEVSAEFEGGLVIDEATDFLSSLKNPVKQEDTDVKIKQEEGYEGLARLEESTSFKSEHDFEISKVKEEDEEEEKDEEEEDTKVAFAAEEEDIGSGVASAMKMLQQKNILTKQEQSMKELKQRQRELLKQKELLELQKQDLSKADSDELRRLNLRQQQLLSNYNPVVNLKYHDEHGNALSTKEAYKQLSHQFHGKAPSNNKIDKIFKKRQRGNF